MKRKRSGRLVMTGWLLSLTFLSACVTPQGIDRVVEPYARETIKSHLAATGSRIEQGFLSGRALVPVDQEISLTEEYFTLAGQARRLRSEIRGTGSRSAQTIEILQEQLDWAQQRRDRLRGQVEAIISRQTGEGLAAAGLLAAPEAQGPDRVFPPAQFFLLPAPFVLVTSPRDHIEITGSYLLSPQLSQAEMGDIEGPAEAGPLSALVERTGGFSLYPAWVSDDDTLRRTLETVAHEWTHAYLLLFYPLGRGYFQDYEMRTLNETVADMVGHEVGDSVYQRYYATTKGPPAAQENAAKAREADFAAQMRVIRTTVDQMLSQGKIDEAEAYMDSQRQELNSKGYALRRLNQAYLALHGTYADEVAFEAPVGNALSELRARSSDLGDFVRKVGAASSYADFERIAHSSD
ncbi:MAG: hypothetical protein Q7R39_16465 [Dehalococcoidia bacterium]|nr:hypothetical protein [Dehalococcoidia bacterium]